MPTFIGERRTNDPGLHEVDSARYCCPNGHCWTASGEIVRDEDTHHVFFKPFDYEDTCPECNEKGEKMIF